MPQTKILVVNIRKPIVTVKKNNEYQCAILAETLQKEEGSACSSTLWNDAGAMHVSFSDYFR